MAIDNIHIIKAQIFERVFHAFNNMLSVQAPSVRLIPSSVEKPSGEHILMSGDI